MKHRKNATSGTADAAAGAGEGLVRVEAIDRDLPAVVWMFSQRLQDGGVKVTPARSGLYLRALQLTKPRSRRQLYITTRAIFVTDLRQLPTFDRIFAEVFGSCSTTEADDFDVGRDTALAATPA